MQKLMTICMWNADPEVVQPETWFLNVFLRFTFKPILWLWIKLDFSCEDCPNCKHGLQGHCSSTAPRLSNQVTWPIGQLIKTGRGIKNIMVFSKNDLVNDGDDDDTWWSYFCQDTLYSYPVKRAIMKLIMLIFDNDDDAGDDDDGEMQGQCTFWRYLTGSCNCNRYR